ncbi:hypothetical protein RJ641_012388 [Dillenia turbinata]|uniref:Protein BIG GRAIN 1-like E n=1 Tax=Dillenia turbinata TaxID=194707 RepID=A0AAN8V1Z9_9MAGN
MSITGLAKAERFYKKSFHRRNDSGELDVFEASRYFSAANEVSVYTNAIYPTKTIKEEKHFWRGNRMSLDMPTRNSTIPIPSQIQGIEKQMKEKKNKQPSSPGGRLASFLNSLFNQTASKKKKSKSTTHSMKDEEESPGGRRKRRSSISHFRSSSTTDSKFMYSSSSFGFRTPPPCANTPTKIYKDFRSYSDHKQVVSLPKYTDVKYVKPSHDDKRNSDLAWLDEKFKFSEKTKNLANGYREKDQIWDDQYQSEEKESRKFGEVDYGCESDSSSDLFELQNYDLGYHSSGLPVYETTHMDCIKRGAPISNGVI